MRLRLFALLTVCGFFILALTMTFVPALTTWVNYAATGLLLIFAALWWVARGEHRLSRFRPPPPVSVSSLGFRAAPRAI